MFCLFAREWWKRCDDLCLTLCYHFLPHNVLRWLKLGQHGFHIVTCNDPVAYTMRLIPFFPFDRTCIKMGRSTLGTKGPFGFGWSLNQVDTPRQQTSEGIRTPDVLIWVDWSVDWSVTRGPRPPEAGSLLEARGRPPGAIAGGMSSAHRGGGNGAKERAKGGQRRWVSDGFLWFLFALNQPNEAILVIQAFYTNILFFGFRCCFCLCFT